MLSAGFISFIAMQPVKCKDCGTVSKISEKQKNKGTNGVVSFAPLHELCYYLISKQPNYPASKIY